MSDEYPIELDELIERGRALRDDLLQANTT